MKNKIIRSSVDPSKISLTVKGIGVAVIPVILFIGGIFGFDFVELDLTQLLNAIATLVSAVLIVYGLIRKFMVKYRK